MLSADEKAISMFNSALKTAIALGVEPSKENAKHIVLNNILQIKESLYDATLLNSLGGNDLKKSFEYYNAIKQRIESL